jgi:transposase-like protein
VILKTYQSGRNPEELTKSIIEAVAAGVSTREIKKVLPRSPGVGKSNVSRHWQKAGSEFVDRLRSADIASKDWVVLMLDGIRLSSEQLAVVGIGITSDGQKYALDFELGSSESLEVSKDLVRRLVKRGFASNRPLLAVLDGSSALKSAVLEFYPDSVVQRCLVHKERNIRSKLSKKHWGELARLFKRLRKVQGKKTALEVMEELREFLKNKNEEARKSLEEAGDELIALHSLDVPNTLHTSLLSTNSIENSFLNVRRKIGRVTRFRAETDQASRWLSFSLLEVEKGFRRIRGYTDLPKLVEALEKRKKEREHKG